MHKRIRAKYGNIMKLLDQERNGVFTILGNHVVGPLVFIEHNSTAELYLDVLKNTIYLVITEILEVNPNEFNMEILFQHDGAYIMRNIEYNSKLIY